MHYTGMAAMRMTPGIDYDPTLFTASLLIAVGASAAALWIAFNLRRNTPYVRLARGGAAMVMGVAIVGMHYTGMAAARFADGSFCGAALDGLSGKGLDKQRQRRDADVIAEADGQAEGEHADKVHRPDPHAHRQRAAAHPPVHRAAPGGADAAGTVLTLLQTRLVASVQLIAALGGGWEPHRPEAVRQADPVGVGAAGVAAGPAQGGRSWKTQLPC